MHLPENAALILIDVQAGFDDPRWGARNNPQAEANVARLLSIWRGRRPVIHVRHHSRRSESPLHPDRAGSAFKPEAQPLDGEPIITKHVHSAFIGTDLEARLRAAGIQTVVIAGLTTDHCVSTTARMASNLGFKTYVVADASATFDRRGYDGVLHPAELIHQTTLASLHNEFATVVTTDEVAGAQA